MSAASPVSFPTSLPLARTRQWSGLHLNQITSMAFSADGSLLATSDLDGVVNILDVINGTAVACIHLDSSVAATAVLWVGLSSLWVGASDGSVTQWNLNEQHLNLAAAIPVYLPAPPRILATLSDSHSQYMIIAYQATAEIWEHKKTYEERMTDWQGLGQLSSNVTGDRVVACWPLSSTSAVIAFRSQGIRIWNFREDVQTMLTNWPPATVIHTAHIVARPTGGGEEDGVFGQIIVVSPTAVIHFALSLLPVPHVQRLQNFPLIPGMVNLSSCAIWGVSPVLITPCADGLAAIDLTYHRFQVVTGSLQERTTQLIHPKDELQPWRLASFSGKFGRHVASAFRNDEGWSIQLWSATGKRPAQDSPRISKQGATPLVRAYELIPRLFVDHGSKSATARRLTSRFVRMVLALTTWAFLAMITSINLGDTSLGWTMIKTRFYAPEIVLEPAMSDSRDGVCTEDNGEFFTPATAQSHQWILSRLETQNWSPNRR